MSAEILRRAAALMRERAEAATPGPWGYHGHSIIRPAEMKDGRAPSYSAAYYRADGEHIASWHPTVALAVAAWLDTAGADLWAHGPLCCADGCMECDDDLWAPHVRRALAVAHAYLGENA